MATKREVVTLLKESLVKGFGPHLEDVVKKCVIPLHSSPRVTKDEFLDIERRVSAEAQQRRRARSARRAEVPACSVIECPPARVAIDDSVVSRQGSRKSGVVDLPVLDGKVAASSSDPSVTVMGSKFGRRCLIAKDKIYPRSHNPPRRIGMKMYSDVTEVEEEEAPEELPLTVLQQLQRGLPIRSAEYEAELEKATPFVSVLINRTKFDVLNREKALNCRELTPRRKWRKAGKLRWQMQTCSVKESWTPYSLRE